MNSPLPASSDTADTLSLQPIEEKLVECPTCGERQTQRLLCRSCSTNLEMALAAQQEKLQRSREERDAALQERIAQRRRASGLRNPDDAGPIGLRFQGRVGRLSYSTATVWLWTALILLTVGLLQRPSFGRLALLLMGLLAVSFFSMRLAVLRCHDCDRHGWWALMVLVPYVGTLASLLLVLVRGSEDANEYGPPPTPGRRLWLWVALGAMTLGIVMAAKASVGLASRLQARPTADEAGQVIELEGRFGNPAADEAFAGDYARAGSPKAFAVSPRGAWGWSSGANLRDAARAAYAQCQARRDPYTPDCEVVNMNGQWLPGHDQLSP
jgi:uncharacterized membrane protein YhaH (DUF805 family)